MQSGASGVDKKRKESLVFESGLQSWVRKKELLLVVVKEMGLGVC